MPQTRPDDSSPYKHASAGSVRPTDQPGCASAGRLLWYVSLKGICQACAPPAGADCWLIRAGSAVFTVLGEGLYTRSQLKEGQTGRPSLPGTIALAAGVAAVSSAADCLALSHPRALVSVCFCLQAVALIEAGGSLQDPGLVLGTVVSTILFFANLRRTVDVGKRLLLMLLGIRPNCCTGTKSSAHCLPCPMKVAYRAPAGRMVKRI